MSNSEITQSAGPLIFSFEKDETSSSSIFSSETIDIEFCNTHSYHFSVRSLNSNTLNCAATIQVSNFDSPKESQWSNIYHADIQGSLEEIFHYKDIFNFKRSRVVFRGSGSFSLKESHTPIYRPIIRKYGIIYESCEHGIKYVKCDDSKKKTTP